MSLATCETISIRAQYNKDGSSVKISNVELDKALADRGEQNAATVELCECPVGYEGSNFNLSSIRNSVQEHLAKSAQMDTTAEKVFILDNVSLANVTEWQRPATSTLEHVL